MIREGIYRSAENYCIEALEDISKRKSEASDGLEILALFATAFPLIYPDKRNEPGDGGN